MSTLPKSSTMNGSLLLKVSRYRSSQLNWICTQISCWKGLWMCWPVRFPTRRSPHAAKTLDHSISGALHSSGSCRESVLCASPFRSNQFALFRWTGSANLQVPLRRNGGGRMRMSMTQSAIITNQLVGNWSGMESPFLKRLFFYWRDWCRERLSGSQLVMLGSVLTLFWVKITSVNKQSLSSLPLTRRI